MKKNPFFPQQLLYGTAMLSLCLFLAPKITIAANTQTFQVKTVLSDGKSGRVWRQWRQQIQEKAVERVSVVLNKTTGGNDTFVNLRFGSGQTFENGRQVFLKNTNSQTVTWNVQGLSPGGQPLVMNAYKGEVHVTSVTVAYKGAPKPGNVRPPRAPRPPQQENDSAEENNDGQWSADDEAMARRCQRLRVRSPRIEVGEIKPTGGLFSGKYKAKGSMFGACIEEAGYFENGTLKQKIDFPISDRFQRKEFKIKVRTGRNAELRIYTVTGREDIVSIDERIAAQKSAFR